MQETVAVFRKFTSVSRNGFAEVVRVSSSGQHALLSLLFIKAGATITYFGAKETYSEPGVFTIQVGLQKHIDLLPNELAYTNHSCDPNIYFDVEKKCVVALKDINPGDELCFFYPSTELDMAAPFSCQCASPKCLKIIKGARYVSKKTLSTYKLNPFIHNEVFSH